MFQRLALENKTNRYVLLAGLVLLFFLSGGSTSNSSCVNGRCFVEVSQSPTALPAGIMIALAALFWPRKSSQNTIRRPVLILRRLGAFVLDFAIVLAALSPFLGLTMLYLEAQATGEFAWSFTRGFSRPSDWQVMVPGILLIQASVVAYFYLHNVLNRQTAGKLIFGYALVSDDDKRPSYVAATVLSVIGMCIWPISLYLAARRADKMFWWDKTSNTKTIPA